MPRILVIADDFTGAAEIGGIATAFGLTAQLACGHLPHASVDTVIVDTDTRHLPADQAARRLQSILERVESGVFDLIYKKTDSVLRGSVAAELKAIVDALRLRRALFIPQNPSRGRTIENGKYLIDGVELHRTSFADDPEFPAITARVRELLDPQSIFGVHVLAMNEPQGASGIFIGEGKNIEDFDRWASQLSGDTLPAGGADFFAAMLRHRGLTHRVPSPISVNTNGALIICGSASSESRRFTETIARTCPMPKTLFEVAMHDKAAVEHWRRSICDDLQSCGRAVVVIGHPSVPGRAAHVRQMLGEVAARVIRSRRVESLFIEGGATAAAIIERLGWLDLIVLGQLSAGVAVLRPVAEPERSIVVKPGSYPWPANLLE